MALYNRHEELGCYEGGDSEQEVLRRHCISFHEYRRDTIEAAKKLGIDISSYQDAKENFYNDHDIDSFEKLDLLQQATDPAFLEIKEKVKVQREANQILAKEVYDLALSRGKDFCKHYDIDFNWQRLIVQHDTAWMSEPEKIRQLKEKIKNLPDIPPKDTQPRKVGKPVLKLKK